jgi:class 3 adenylate cyclase
MRAARALAAVDEELAIEIMARLVADERDEMVPDLIAYMRDTWTVAGFVAHSEVIRDANITALASGARCPVLIVHAREHPLWDVETARRLAAALVNGSLTLWDGRAGFPHHRGDLDRKIALVDGFLNVGSASSRDATPPASPFRTILFTDIEGHTAMMSRLGDARGRDILREHERLTRDALREHSGTEVKSMGDGFMASFGSTQRAVECAIALQQAFAEPVGSEQIRVRIGINAGEPIAEDDDLFGASVIAAARIASRASGGQVLVADVVRQLVAGKGFLFHDTGEHDLKGPGVYRGARRLVSRGRSKGDGPA